MFLSFFTVLLTSPLLQTILFILLGAIASVLNGALWYMCLPLIIVVIRFRPFVFELLVMTHLIEDSLGNYNWFSKIDEQIILGGIPIADKGHDKTLQQKYGVTCVVSVVENFEINSNTLAGQALNGDEWKRQDVEHGLFPSPDFYPPSFDLMNSAADFMAEHFRNRKGGVVYVHCKSGMGRSASVVIAYLMKHKRMKLLNAYDYVRKERKEIFRRKSSQMANLMKYETYLQERYSGGIISPLASPEPSRHQGSGVDTNGGFIGMANGNSSYLSRETDIA